MQTRACDWGGGGALLGWGVEGADSTNTRGGGGGGGGGLMMPRTRSPFWNRRTPWQHDRWGWGRGHISASPPLVPSLPPAWPWGRGGGAYPERCFGLVWVVYRRSALATSDAVRRWGHRRSRLLTYFWWRAWRCWLRSVTCWWYMRCTDSTSWSAVSRLEAGAGTYLWSRRSITDLSVLRLVLVQLVDEGLLLHPRHRLLPQRVQVLLDLLLLRDEAGGGSLRAEHGWGLSKAARRLEGKRWRSEGDRQPVGG